ncbi:MAG: hypothetical protein DRQ78_04240 [Epsilonproteobacteria bacterium]|nr:MAG: hypothetical protein DRQ78_04240 [Campylobacterota bacterium]
MNKILLFTCYLLIGSTLQAELFTEYFKDGTVKSKVEYVKDTRTDINEGIKDGWEYIYYNSSELAFKVKNIKGKRDGALDWYDRDNNHLEVIYYQMGKRHGINKLFYADGTLRSEVTYFNDKKEGSKKDYYSTSELAREVKYIHDKKEGIETEYYKNGKVSAKVNYKNNYKEGEKHWFNEKGNIIKSETYKMDRPIAIMKKVQAKKPDETIKVLQGLNFDPNSRKVN